MYAVIKTGGKQYSVKVGDTLKVEKLAAGVGDSLALGEVIFVGGDKPAIGSPVVDGASVTAEVLSHGKGEYIRGFTYRRKKHNHRTYGHRQPFTEVRITNIAV